MSIDKVTFEDREEGTFVAWNTPYGHQEINLSLRRFKAIDGKVKVILGGIPDESLSLSDVTRVVDMEHYSFKFKNKQFNLTGPETLQVRDLVEEAQKQRAAIKAKQKEEKEARQRWNREYYESDEYTESLKRELERLKEREQTIINILRRRGVEV